MLLCRLLTCHQPQLVSLLVIFVVASIIDIASPVPVPGHQGIVEITLLAESWSSDHRVRRAAGSDLPDALSFSIPVDDDKAVLRMNRSRLLPVIMSDEESTREANGFYEGAAVYTDLSMGSAMIVKRRSGHYMLQGSFVHADVAWDLQHETRHKRDSSNATSKPHRISRQVTSSTNVRGDALEYPGAMTKRNVTGNDTLQQQERQTESDQTPGQPTQHVVEVAFVVDYADYAKWVQYVGLENTPREMRLWYTYVAESVNTRYHTIKDPDIAISTTVTILRILNNPNDAHLFTNRTGRDNELDEDVGLKKFMEWYPNQEDIPPSDHYMLFTGMNLTGATLGDLSGIAYEEALCYREGISICENDFNGNVGHTAAHELAHSLSAKHDEPGNEKAGCTSDYQYIMAVPDTLPVDVIREGNNWRFSPCSIESFKSFLPTVDCTRETFSETTPLPESAPGERAGEVLSRDEQCRLSFQTATSYFCEDVQEYNGGMMDLCRGMVCKNPTSLDCEFVAPQDYTPCDKDKWCVTGQCVDKREINTATSTAATTAAQPLITSSTATTTPSTYSSPRNANYIRTSNLVNITSSAATATSGLMTTPSTTSTTPSQLSTLASSTTTIASVTFCLCLFLLCFK